ncbi:hypothetical protein [Actinoplanes palleronii]|uniref:GYF domain-containing protein n=1 Tax=Actinoplanes palleronii TaxID=113570 RepID=A0ABQ4BJ71_9ACTN|nr:hypothetical protein [Actinoplanes palleronii]GIE70730.1 hypothetical protein Apa02nite_068380 [Actinoplanes palleronii]
MATQTYWLADPDGVHAPADGAATRDEMAAAGWVLVDELRPSDQVWTYNEQVRGWSKFGRDILHVWEARGWVPSAPPLVEGDVGPVIDLPVPGAEPAAVPVPDSKPEPKTTEAASPSTSKKENDRA